MLSDSAFETLRMAATVAVALPTVRVLISSGDRLLVEVSWDPGSGDPDAVHLRPCAFRSAVACGQSRRDMGYAIGFSRLDPGDHHVVDIVPTGFDRRLPGGIYQVSAQGGWRLAFPSLLPSDHCRSVLRQRGGRLPTLGFHHDEAMGVTLVHARTAGGGVAPAPELIDAVVTARAILLAEELVLDVSADARQP